MAEPELNKIIDAIMKNPDLVNQIKNLAINDENGESHEAETEEKAKEEAAIQSEEVAPVRTESIENSERTEYIPASPQKTERTRRNELLRALKPYVSSERGKAIESMMTIADILDMMREK